MLNTMPQEQPTVQYFALIDTGGSAEAATGLVRRTHTKPMVTDEELRGDFTWHPTDYLQRYYYLGSNDQDHVEITEEFAEQLMDRWRRRREERLRAQGEAGG